ncbi:UNVERIFIED_CONTAM: hypothetical protein Scaly_1709800 [Sesamum calycinum]|uniref:MD-2-related lipid-recognition domain-containing protein n=1 Tax=Sesamum calycinum TaxID=2727403 RepID=A0AAW2NUJ9_9LAMI
MLKQMKQLNVLEIETRINLSGLVLFGFFDHVEHNKKANYAVKVNGLEIDPYPISRGKNTTFQIAAATIYPFNSVLSGFHGISPSSENENLEHAFVFMFAKLDEAIKGGKLVIDVSYFGFHIHSEDHNLCAETSCPVTVGDFVVSHSQELPGITPPGSYTLKMTMVDEHKKQLTCITFDFSIGFIAEENSKADM